MWSIRYCYMLHSVTPYNTRLDRSPLSKSLISKTVSHIVLCTCLVSCWVLSLVVCFVFICCWFLHTLSLWPHLWHILQPFFFEPTVICIMGGFDTSITVLAFLHRSRTFCMFPIRNSFSVTLLHPFLLSPLILQWSVPDPGLSLCLTVASFEWFDYACRIQGYPFMHQKKSISKVRVLGKVYRVPQCFRKRFHLLTGFICGI